MLSAKSPFATSTTEGAEMPTVNDPDKTLKRWQLEAGRTSKRIEDLDSQLATAVSACEQARHTYGACVESGEDATAALDTLTRAEGHIRACEAALTVAKEKDQAAQTELLLAERQAAIEKEFEALAFLKLTVAPKVDDLIDQIEHVTAELATALNNARLAKAGGDHNSFLATAKLELYRFANRALCPVTDTGAVADCMMRYSRWSECIPDPETARTRRRS